MSEEKENMEKTTQDETRNASLGEQIENEPATLEIKDPLEFMEFQPEPELNKDSEELNLVDILYGTVAAPSETFSKLGKNPPVLKSVFIVIAIYVFMWLLSLSDLRNTGLEIMNDFGQVPGQLLLGNVLAVAAIFGVIFAVLIWFIVSGSLSLWASLLGGQDNAKGLLVCYGFAMIPSVFSGILQTLTNLAGLHVSMNWLVGILVFIWIIYLQMVAVRETQGLSTGLSLFVALTPILGSILLIILMGLLVLLAFSGF